MKNLADCRILRRLGCYRDLVQGVLHVELQIKMHLYERPIGTVTFLHITTHIIAKVKKNKSWFKSNGNVVVLTYVRRRKSQWSKEVASPFWLDESQRSSDQRKLSCEKFSWNKNPCFVNHWPIPCQVDLAQKPGNELRFSPICCSGAFYGVLEIRRQ